MKNALLISFLAITLSSCAMTPVLDAHSTVDGPVDTAMQATIWADNTDTSYGMITKVDGKRMPSRKGGGYPYSVAVSPGIHKLTFFVMSHHDPNPLASSYADFEEQIEVESGHAYSISFQNIPGGNSVIARVTDLGLGKVCRYEVTGKMQRGYVPVALRCN
jgi:hypothetical protein